VAELAPNRVLHAAAVTATPEQERADPTRVFDINAGGTLNMLEAARHAGVERFVFVSSSGIYGAAPPTPKRTEEGPLQIGGLYAIGKQASEALCSRYSEMYDLSVAVGRLGTAYGPMERTTGSRSGMSSVQRATLMALAGDEVTVHNADIARDFCYAIDIAEAFVALLAAETLSYPIYNVAGPEAAPLRSALETLASAVPGFAWREVDDPADAELAMLPAKARAGLDLSRLAEDTGWRPEHDLERGIRAYLAWLASEAAAGRGGV
jgi:UDP-glucuronate 4-epimerase